jgi:hypothetical protein
MAKRASLSFDALKGSKATPATGEGEAQAARTAPTAKAEKRGRGRPAKRDPDAKTFGMTLRIPGSLRLALRRAAERETDAKGRVVSVHDVILEAVDAYLARKGVKVDQ